MTKWADRATGLIIGILLYYSIIHPLQPIEKIYTIGRVVWNQPYIEYRKDNCFKIKDIEKNTDNTIECLLPKVVYVVENLETGEYNTYEVHGSVNELRMLTRHIEDGDYVRINNLFTIEDELSDRIVDSFYVEEVKLY